MEPRIFGILQRIHAEPDATRTEELKALHAAELAAHFRDPRNHWDLQELSWDFFNTAWRDVQGGFWSTPGAEDIIGNLIDVKTVDQNATDFIEEDVRGMRAYFQGKGGQIESSIIRAERQQMPREELVTAIDLHLDEIGSDFWGSLGSLQAQAMEKVRTAPAQKLVDLIMAAITTGPTFGTFAASTLSSDNIDPILNAVASKSAGRATIFGTLIGIRKLARIGLDYGFAIQERIFQDGVIAQYSGYPVVQLSNWEDFEGRFVLNDNELYIVGKNAGKLTWFGDTPKTQVLQEESFWRRWESARDVGMSIYGAPKGRVGRVVLT